MKTKDFIAMLQKEDPTGEHHIRMPDGIPRYCIMKEGYYDGAYSYIDEDGNYVITKEGYKIDVYCEDLENFIWENSGDTGKVKIAMDDIDGRWSEKIEKISREAREFEEKSMNEYVVRVMRMMKEGWLIVQPSSELITRGHVQWYIKDISKFVTYKTEEWRKDTENQKKLCHGECEAVVKSGLFKTEKVSDMDLLEWKLVI